MSATPPPEGYLTRSAAAARLGWYHERLTNAIKRGDLHAYELNGRVLLREADVAALAAKLAAEPKPLDPNSL